MEKIFISHSSKDEDLAINLMDFLQTQYGLTRKNFFLTSDGEFHTGDKWIEVIEMEMNNAKIILPIITPEYLESHFCLCELGAAWIKKSSILPVALHPKKHLALDSTPYRSVFQLLSLGSADDLIVLGDAFAQKGGYEKPSFVSLKKRAKSLWEKTIQKYLEDMHKRKVITPEEVAELRTRLEEAERAFDEADNRASKLQKDIKAIKALKDAEEVKTYEQEDLEEWEEFEKTIADVNNQLKSISTVLASVIYHEYAFGGGGFEGEQELHSDLRKEETAGKIKYDEGWRMRDENKKIRNVTETLDMLSKLMERLSQSEKFMDKFDSEYNEEEFNLKYTAFWENVLGQPLYSSIR